MNYQTQEDIYSDKTKTYKVTITQEKETSEGDIFEVKPLKKILILIGFILLNVLVLCVIVLSLMIFTSPYEIFPWYEPDTIVFVGIFYLFPFYLVIGVFLNILVWGLPISKLNRLLPFLTGAGFVFLTLSIDHFYGQVEIKGICFGSVMFLAVMLSAIKDSLIVSRLDI